MLVVVAEPAVVAATVVVVEVEAEPVVVVGVKTAVAVKMAKMAVVLAVDSVTH